MTRVALVTGAGSGIGRAAALALGMAGYKIVLAGRRAAALQETANLMTRPATVIACDVTDTRSVDALFGELRTRFERLDLLFNNAGVDVPGIPIEDVSFADWSTIVATNLTGQFLCAQGAFRLMKAQSPKGGRIINNGSISAQSPRPNSVPYAASKHGVTGLTKGLSIEGRAHGITACQIDVGNASTDPSAERAPSLQPDGRRVSEPAMHVDDVARAVAFVASLPPEANVPFLTITASAMPFLGRG